MSDNYIKLSKSVLEPNERIAEILSGLIMALTFTGSLSVIGGGHNPNTMLVAALGCNLAWGIIDGFFYLMDCLSEKGRNLMTYRTVRLTHGSREAQRLIADALPAVLASVMKAEEFEALHQRLKKLPEPPRHARLSRSDWRGAFGVAFLMFISTFPIAVPFIFMQSAQIALRVSNVIGIIMLFFSGVVYGRCVGRTPWIFGVSMVLLGVVLVAITMALGG